MNLTDMADRFGSDKGTQHVHPHRYSFLYDLIFFPIKNLPIHFLEMGLAAGGPEVGGAVDRSLRSPSVDMWLQFFSSAQVFGFDISDFSQMNGPRFSFIRGDSGKEHDLLKILEKQPKFDVIIDDASHASFHQQLAFRVLFESLKGGGLYIIEDLQWQSPYFEDSLPNVPKTAQFMSEFFLKNHYAENSVLSKTFMQHVKQKVFSYAEFPSFIGESKVIKLIVLRIN